MKRIAIFLLCLSVARATEVALFVVGSGGATPPAVTSTAQFVMQGIDQIHVWINGVDKGIIRAPFTASYTSLGVGQTNVIVVEYCDFIKRTGTNTFYIVSGTRNYPIKPF